MDLYELQQEKAYMDSPAKMAGGLVRPATLAQRLTAKKQRLEADLAEVNKAIEFFEKYPEMEEGINILGRAL